MTAISSRHPRKASATWLSVVFVLAIASLVAPTNLLRADPPATTQPTLSELQRQRVQTLQEASDTAHKLLEQGLTSAEETFRIDRLLLDAQLESTASAQDRLRVLQRGLETAKKHEDLVLRQERAGFATALATLEAKAYRLQVEIELAKATAQ